jgi:hypothetical protein
LLRSGHALTRAKLSGLFTHLLRVHTLLLVGQLCLEVLPRAKPLGLQTRSQILLANIEPHALIGQLRLQVLT